MQNFKPAPDRTRIYVPPRQPREREYGIDRVLGVIILAVILTVVIVAIVWSLRK